MSAHNPLIIVTKPDNLIKQFVFRFENEWLSHPEFENTIKIIWNKPNRAKSVFDKIQQKLKLCKQYLKDCDLNKKGEKEEIQIQQILSSLEQIEEYVDLDASQME